jgi:putative addiction module component (TIGR02574 family)
LRVISSITYRASKKQALRLSLQERGALIRRLIVSLEGVPEDSPESIAKAWDEEMARRVADMEAGRTEWIPAAEVLFRIRALISATKITHAD